MNKASFYLVSGNIAAGRATTEHYMDVMFNPSSYSVDSSAEYSPATDLSARVDYLQFSKLTARTLSFDLYFDTVNSSAGNTMPGASAQLKEIFFSGAEDVRHMTGKLHKLIELQSKDDAMPPVAEFQWGSFRFRGVITSMKEKYETFLPDGRPVRATVSVTMREYFGSARDIKNQTNTADNNASAAVASSEKEDFAQKAQEMVRSEM